MKDVNKTVEKSRPLDFEPSSCGSWEETLQASSLQGIQKDKKGKNWDIWAWNIQKLLESLLTGEPN